MSHPTKKQKTIEKPPIRIDSTLQLAWGLTLNFSHEPTQQKVGASYLQDFQNLKQQFKDDKKSLDYLDNLSSVLTAYLRTSGFERDIYVSYLNMYRDIRDARVKNINDLADLASFSSGSFLIRLAAFLGFGSLADVIGTITNYSRPSAGLPFNLNVVLLGGLLGIGLIVVVAKLTRGFWIARAENECYTRLLEFWSAEARPGFRRELENLAERLKVLVNEYYPSYTEKVLTDKTELGSLLDAILPYADLYKITWR